MRARLLALAAVLVTVFAVYAYQHSTAAVGRAAPDFELSDAAGHAVRLDALRGRVVLLEFWASWCTVCREDTPALAAFANRYGNQVAVVGVDWREPEAALRQWVGKYSLAFPNVRDGSGLVARKYGLTGVPEAWWIAPDGTARLHVLGPSDFEQLQAQYRQVTGTPIDPTPGPTPVAMAAAGTDLWLAAGGPYGGLWRRPLAGSGAWVRASLPGSFTAVASDGTTLLAAGAQAGLVASGDGGMQWRALPAAPALTGPITALADDPAHPGTFYAWVGGRLVRATSLSAGFGPLPVQPPLGPGATVVALAARGPDLLVASDQGILVSADGGAQWHASPLRRTPLGTQEFATAAAAMADQVPLVATGAVIAGNGSAYLAGPDGVYQAADAGGGAGTRLLSAPARAFVAVVQPSDGAFWAIAPNGDLYGAAGPSTNWRLVATASGQAGAA